MHCYTISPLHFCLAVWRWAEPCFPSMQCRAAPKVAESHEVCKCLGWWSQGLGSRRRETQPLARLAARLAVCLYGETVQERDYRATLWREFTHNQASTTLLLHSCMKCSSAQPEPRHSANRHHMTPAHDTTPHCSMTDARLQYSDTSIGLFWHSRTSIPTVSVELKPAAKGQQCHSSTKPYQRPQPQPVNHNEKQLLWTSAVHTHGPEPTTCSQLVAGAAATI